jgi:hypothetical protein
MFNNVRLACLVVVSAAVLIRGGIGQFVHLMVVLAVFGAFYRLNQWLVTRKGLDHRPYYVPSHWGPVGTLIIVCAQPAGWKRFP